jgi:hypothetical protein
MAFLDADNPQVVPSVTVEERTNFWGTRLTRNVTEYRLTWAIDATGGESPPADYLGADLTWHGPEIAYGGGAGLYVAIYALKGAWS